jgi:hypothetical protein
MTAGEIYTRSRCLAKESLKKSGDFSGYSRNTGGVPAFSARPQLAKVTVEVQLQKKCENGEKKTHFSGI